MKKILQILKIEQGEKVMQHPTFYYYVSRPEESEVLGKPSTYIPTYGHIAGSFDVYSTLGISNIDNRPDSWCFTDTDTAGALGRLIDGPIKSKVDIEKAESALRAILLHDFVQIMVPCVKAEYEHGHYAYVRFDKDERNEASFAGFNAAPCEDFLMALELVNVRHGQIIGSTKQDSKLIGTSIEDNSENYHRLISAGAEMINAFPIDVGATAHYSMPAFQSPCAHGPAGFIDGLYNRIYKPWIDVQSDQILYIDIKLPPLVSIVLSRARHRQDIPEVIRTLREELAEVRSDLNRLNKMLDSTISQADINAQTRRIDESFDSIIPEAMLTDAERRLRRIASVFGFARPLWKLYGIAVGQLAADPDRLLDLYRSGRAATLKSKRIVSRSVSASKFSELLRMDKMESFRGMLTSHFDMNEIELISKSN